jgi:hypothetical protein
VAQLPVAVNDFYVLDLQLKAVSIGTAFFVPPSIKAAPFLFDLLFRYRAICLEIVSKKVC